MLSQIKSKSLKIKKAYEDAKIYFFIYKFVRLFNIYNVAKLYYKIRKNFIKIKKGIIMIKLAEKIQFLKKN